MTSAEECRAAIGKLSGRILDVDEASRRKHLVERTISVEVSDLGTAFDMRLTHSGLQDVTSRPSAAAGARAQIHITVTSDDLVALTEERLDPGRALLSGRVKLNASLTDLMRMRKLL